MDNGKSQLSKLSLSMKVLVTCFVISLSFGYIIALLQIYNRTEFSPTKTVSYYRGVESDNELEAVPPPSFGSLLSVAHVHSFSQPVMLVLMGLCFAMSYVTEGGKIIFIVMTFASSFVSNITPFLIRYVSKKLSILLPCSQMILMLSFFIMAFVVIYDLWYKKEDRY